jgi:tRNA-dihydrouridine synthase B
MQIGPYQLSNRLILAPMAGITDRPFRSLCRRYGAALAVSEMIIANPKLSHHHKTQKRSDHAGEPWPRSVQILGNVPEAMAETARMNVDRGADIIDINMGCPAKKVCQKAAGSALLKDESLVGRILEAVVGAVNVPVTLKIRTGWDLTHRNAPTIARIAESAGIQALAVHGRTRACGFSGSAEYLTIQQIKQIVTIPVIANGDIDTPEKARAVLASTQVDAIMIGRAAWGKPWLFREIDAFLSSKEPPPPLVADEVFTVIIEHLHELYAFYGERQGLGIARKHVGWYLSHLQVPQNFISMFNALETTSRQLSAIIALFKKDFREFAA